MLGLIWAQAAGGVIGADGALPWHLPEDMALFRAVTIGSTVVMGRRTWDSLPERFRPLPGRRNIVLSRSAAAAPAGAELARHLEQVPGEGWVIGGAQVYAALAPRAELAVITHVGLSVPGDVHAPALGPDWRSAPGQPWAGPRTSASGIRWSVEVRLRGAAAVPDAVTAALQVLDRTAG